MADITNYDRNFALRPVEQGEAFDFYDATCAPFQVHGLLPGAPFLRMPQTVADQVNEGVAYLCKNTAGGRIRFVTDSSRVVLRANMPAVGKMSHFALTGSAGFDLYQKVGDEWRFQGIFTPPFEIADGYESCVYLLEEGEKEIMIHFPLYSCVSSLLLGIDKGARLALPTPYATPLPVVYYGSSITQGGCASRPGNSYPAILSRVLDCDHINLGFSGSARGETVMAEYIAGLKMSVFVYDYDHNAPSPEYLAQTHWPFLAHILKAQPNLPVLLLGRPVFHLTKEEKERLAVVQASYEKAKAMGARVAFLSGPQLILPCVAETATVDGCHPNDSGFVSMAEQIAPLLKALLA